MIRRFPGRWTVLASVAGLILAVSTGASPRPDIVDARTRGTVSFDEMIRRIEGKDFVFVGESHDNPAHHQAQLSVIEALEGRGVRIAIGLEMFMKSSQEALDDWVAGRIPENEFVAIFDRNWEGGLWTLYRPIFLYARERRVPMVGLNLDRRYVERVSRSGIESLDDGGSPVIRNVSCDADGRYRSWMRRAMSGHGTAYEFRKFCEAQVLWDATMAWNLVDYAGSHPGTTVVVLAGLFHSWKHGIPERVRRQSGYSFKVIIPRSEGGPFGYDVDREDADYLWRLDEGEEGGQA